jgi:hypothetical protein
VDRGRIEIGERRDERHLAAVVMPLGDHASFE